MNDLISSRVQKLNVSGIRRVFDLAQKLENPINLSIGQPDFPVADSIKDAACNAIQQDYNGYTPTQGNLDLIQALKKDSDQRGLRYEDLIVTSGVSGGLFLTFSTLLNEGDEVIIPDPYFLMYKQLGLFFNVKINAVPIYPDFKFTAEKLEPYLSSKTKLLVLNAPSNPTGVGLEPQDWSELMDLLNKYPDLIVLSDEIYRCFDYSDNFRSPAQFRDNVITLDGFSKSHGLTGWRVGWASGPKSIIQSMAKLQQFTFVCSTSIAQKASLKAFSESLKQQCQIYKKKRDLVFNQLNKKFEVQKPDGTFYLFPKIPKSYKCSQDFVEAALEKEVLVIPGNVFSERDTHFRISFATDDQTLEKGIERLLEMA